MFEMTALDALGGTLANSQAESTYFLLIHAIFLHFPSTFLGSI